jgi:hypothetical protein
MRYQKFSGILEEIVERYPNIDMVEFLQDKLQIPTFKAEELAARIEKQYCRKGTAQTGQKIVRSILEKPINAEQPSKTSVYSVDCLSEKEFEHFIKWLISELKYEVQPEKYAAHSGFDLVVTKEGEKIAVQARRYPKTHLVSDSMVLLSQDAKRIYECDKSIVVATAYFTEQAMAEAQRLNVELWDRDTLDAKIAEIRKNVEQEVHSCFPSFNGSLLQSLIGLAETKDFTIEPKEDEKFDLYLPGVKFPLLTFQACSDVVIRCVYRIKYNEPVGEAEGEALISCDDENNRSGPAEAEAYAQIVEYLEQFVE